MKRNVKYESGEMFGNIMFISDVTLGRGRKARFKCFCGEEFITTMSSVKTENTKSCGCLKSKTTTERNFKHGNATRGGKDYWYYLWNNIRERCYQPRNNDYHRYGGRGIVMQENWINDFKQFKDDVLDCIGERPEGMSLDRKNNDGNYQINNLRWATAQQQALNRCNNK